MVRLFMAAPDTDWTLLRVLAVALDGAATVEGLLIIRDAIREGAAEALLEGWHRQARELTALAELVDREASWRSPNYALPRQA